MAIIRMTDLDLAEQRVLIREDLNVPVHEGRVVADQRIRAALPTLERALEQRARVMVMSHLGRPKEGQPDPAASLAPVGERLAELLDRPVRLARDWIEGVEVAPGELVLCENVRFLAGEKSDDETLAKRMAALCDIYVMDAFGTAHRAQASTHGVARYAPVACAGPLLMAELEALGRALADPTRPLVAVVGGAKVSGKLEVLEALSRQVDRLILGGGIANTFLAAAGKPIGRSLHEADLVPMARRLMEDGRERGAEIPLPEDVVVAEAPSADASPRTVTVDAVGPEDMILDIGPRTAARYALALAEAGTILWNGPVGVFELEPFAAGTRTVAQAIAASAAYSLAGGGDTLAAIELFRVESGISYVSTGGGAFLEFVEGKRLPAIAALEARGRS